MTEQTSRLNRDVYPQTSVSDRDVSAERHAQTVTSEREPLLICSALRNPRRSAGRAAAFALTERRA